MKKQTPTRAPGGFLRELKEVVLPSGPRPAEGLFLDRLTPTALERELEAAGIFAHLEGRGYSGFTLELDREEREHRLRLRAQAVETPLIELRASELTLVPKEPLLKKRGVDVLYLLAVHWLALQDPCAAFTAQRPALPGQECPGLGVGQRLFARLNAWAYEWGKDALVNYPAYYHNAVFYSRVFHFLSPRREGRMDALRRDLAGLDVGQASWAVDLGRVREDPGARVLRWKAAEMIAPLGRALKLYLKSDEYRAAAAAARDAVRYRLVE